MFSTFTLLVAAGACIRLSVSWLLARRYGVILALPQALVVILLVLSCLPEYLSPVPFPAPLSLTLGAVLPDLLQSRN